MSDIGKAANKIRFKVEGNTTFRSATDAAERVLEGRPEIKVSLGFTESELNVIRYALDLIGNPQR